jgi:hypothetical protein
LRRNLNFIRRVEIESNQRADEKFNQMKYTEWPKYFRENIEPKVRELETKIKANTFSLLKGPWTIDCDSCGKRQPVEISSQAIQSLLINGFIDLKCDSISILLPESPITNLMLNPHNTRIQLSKMIQDYLK